MVRSFAPYDKTKQRSKSGDKKKYRERTSNEWDARIDCDVQYAEEICKRLEDSKNVIDYCLVSGIEKADAEAMNNASKENHIHIALIFKYVMRRDQVLSVIRGFTKKTDEYCAPRNKKFTYAGWYLHHVKLDWKLVLEPALRLEFGVLPEDEPTEYNLAAIRRLYKKFGCDDITRAEIYRIKFSKYLIE